MSTTQPFVVPEPTAPPPHAPWQRIRTRDSGLATASLVLGILGIFLFCTLIPAFLALVFGLASAATIKRSDGAMTGLGLARAGWILGLTSLLGTGALVAAIAAGAFDGVELAGEFEVGDCVDLSGYVDTDGSDDDVEADGLPIVVCSRPHDGEIIHLGEIDRFDEYPGWRAVRSHVELTCTGVLFSEYVGVDYIDSELGLFVFEPTADTWRSGDRDFMCVATGPGGEPLVGSVRGSNR